ncbi:protein DETOXIFICATION 55-like [Impatiens glandulifera]|uniref:protein DETOXIFICATION 55-like n=1 Tax=Impatiens glandulifera TaxID=253017 RepID=UPI001FB13C8B|nr:protein DETOXIFICATION 55-like [Impatiens glandulifera]
MNGGQTGVLSAIFSNMLVLNVQKQLRKNRKLRNPRKQKKQENEMEESRMEEDIVEVKDSDKKDKNEEIANEESKKDSGKKESSEAKKVKGINMLLPDQLDDQERPTKAEVLRELKRTSNIGFPILAMGLVSYLKNMISVACMGRLGSLELAGGALAIGFTNITGYSVLSGLAIGMEPLCSQAFGSGNLNLVLLTVKRTVLMLLLVSVFIGLVWFSLEPLLLSLNQNPDITNIASIYCRISIPDLFANSLLHPVRLYLRSKGTTWPLMWTTSIAVIIHVPLTYFLAFNLSFGVRGIAVSNYITNFVTLFLLMCYLVYNQRKLVEPCDPLLKQSVGDRRREWFMLIRLSVQSCLAVCLEWWWYELIMTLVAGYLEKPHVALGTSAIVIQTTSVMYTLPSAISAAVSSRVGNELGTGRGGKARLATEVAIGLALATSSLGLLLTTFGRETWGRLFTEDNEVLDLTISVLPIIGLCELANCPQTTCCGVMRGCARPGIGAAINLYSFYLVGAPVAVVLAFYFDLGFLGLSYGLLAAQIVCVMSALSFVYRINWDGESMKAKYLMGGGNMNEEEEDERLITGLVYSLD